MSDKPNHDWTQADPLFDGHLDRSADRMTTEDCLRWIDEGARFLQWARQVRQESGLETDGTRGTQSPC